MQGGAAPELKLAHGLAFADLYRRDGPGPRRRRIRGRAAVAPSRNSLARLDAARADPDALSAKDESALIIAVAPHLERFVSQLFGIADAGDGAAPRATTRSRRSTTSSASSCSAAPPPRSSRPTWKASTPAAAETALDAALRRHVRRTDLRAPCRRVDGRRGGATPTPLDLAAEVRRLGADVARRTREARRRRAVQAAREGRPGAPRASHDHRGPRRRAGVPRWMRRTCAIARASR